MLRFIYVILLNLFRAPYMIPKMRREADHPEKYSAEERYELARHCIRLMKVTGGIHTKAYGQENLPKEGGYMMYPNHQGIAVFIFIFHPDRLHPVPYGFPSAPVHQCFLPIGFFC